MDKTTYGASKQFPTPPDKSPSLDKKDITKIQQILGTLLYYARMVDSTLLVAISDLETQQTHPMERTLKNLHQLLDYCCKYPSSTVIFVKSDMILKDHSDAGYLNVNGSKRRCGVFFYLVNKKYTNNDNNGGY